MSRTKKDGDKAANLRVRQRHREENIRMEKRWHGVTSDFSTIGPTQKKAFTPGKKFTMGNIDSRAAAKKRRKKG